MQTDPSWELQGEGIAAIAAAVAYFILRCIESVSICSSDVCDSMLSKQIWYLCDKSQDETPAPGVRLFCQSGELCSSSATTQAYGQQSAAAAAHAEVSRRGSGSSGSVVIVCCPAHLDSKSCEGRGTFYHWHLNSLSASGELDR
ncbi:hypothetical protein MPTK1_7g18090 [Marchantia polymorpha subsp. ruderalis]|uniref:Uncharacterized protein n=2 Tax=Marchantia polymorpha TaxID=3197 RepID=A0AAF6C0Z3_MARPO|nr:hypothetical protein MARPO_0102s0031 [Marchantia polymorpha]BBN17927.1 hypothetical protein Mp_7g18090 [Marchantia polymorpha subsp. ruderalis]|eukprot:PTQ32163.1 hypothetical protein MARPO_0102s0031 [Marchantia polymorpha]